MTAAPGRGRLVTPPGMCLTDIWPRLNSRQRGVWVTVVAREARAVRIEADAARAGKRLPLDLTGIEAAAERARADGAARAVALVDALTGAPDLSPEESARVRRMLAETHRLRRRRRVTSGLIDYTPWRVTAEEHRWSDAELRAAFRERRRGSTDPQVVVLARMFRRLERRRAADLAAR